MFQVLVNGLATGSIYALIAIGFALIFNILKFSNFSYGATMTSAAFIAYFMCTRLNLGLVGTLVCSALAGGLIGLFGEFIGFRRITLNHSAPTYFFVSSITLATMYEGFIALAVGANFFRYPNFFEVSSTKLLGAVISKTDILMFVISAVSLIILAYIIQKTRIGRAVRAVSFDRDTAQLMGINATLVVQVVFFISGIFAGLAGCFLGIKYTLYSTLGSLVTKGFIASVIGGLGSLVGAVIGAVLLGILEAFSLSIFGSGWATIVTFVIMMIFVLIRPQGIAGSNVQEKA